LPISIPPSWSGRERATAQLITADGLRAHTRFLADDLLEGRAPASRGGQLAVAYIHASLERLGLKPGAPDGTFLQTFPIIGLDSKVSTAPALLGPKGPLSPGLIPGDNFIITAGSQAPSASVKEAEVVFVGYGITAPEQAWDDYAGLDVHGKIVLVMNNDPEQDPSLFGGKTRLYYGRWTYKYEEAARHGAAGAIIIHTTPSAGYPWQVVQTSWSGEDFELPTEGEPRVALKMWMTDELAKRAVGLAGQDLDALRAKAMVRGFRAIPLGLKLTVGIQTRVRRLNTANVLAVLPGTDPKLRDEMVVFSAHHDHLGIKLAKGGDSIYNGALDNASGVAAILTAAEALVRATPGPRRSVLFAAVGGEESGLLGSEYLARHPPVSTGRLAANINIDCINIFGRTRDVEAIGLAKSNLDELVTAAVHSQNRVVVPDQFPDRGSFYRSDQLNFARIGVPAVYLKGGLDFVGRAPGWGREHVDEYIRTRYHQPSDELGADWDFDGAVDDVRLLTIIALRIADQPSLPAWRKGDEFEAARLRAPR